MSPQVASIFNACDTGLAKGLSDQVIAKLNRMVKSPILVKVEHRLIDIESDAVNPYLQPKAVKSLIAAVEDSGKVIIINSMFRTIVQQHIIRKQYDLGLCGITAAALPGRSNHEKGLAIDIEDPYSWQYSLESNSWIKLGVWDDMHYDYWDGRQDIPKLQCYAFQQLWNQYNPSELIAVDGLYGAITARCIDRSPIDGWD
jgi:N-acetylmuramoyl-L-alanine amidase